MKKSMMQSAIARQDASERSYEHGLPEYLQNNLDAYKDALKNGFNLMDCLWGELYGSINVAEISDGVITPEPANYLREKFLWGKKEVPNKEMECLNNCVGEYSL